MKITSINKGNSPFKAYNFQKQNNFINFASKSSSDEFIKNTNVKTSKVQDILAILNKEILKRKIQEVYDVVCRDVKKDADKLGVDFVKPRLVFKHDEGVTAAHIRGTNEIRLTDKILKPKARARLTDTSLYKCFKLENGKSHVYVSYDMDNENRELLESESTYIEGDELLFYLGSIFKHELQHALQEQMILCCEGGIEKYLLKRLRSLGYEPDEDDIKYIRNQIELFQYYQPKNKFTLDTKFSHEIEFSDEEKVLFEFSMGELIDAYVNYSKEDNSYYANIMELDARIAEMEYFQNWQKLLPNLRIPDDVSFIYKAAASDSCYPYLVDVND